MNQGHDYKASMSGDEFEAVHHVKKTKTQAVLGALLLGMEVKLDEHKYRLFESTSGGYTPGIVQDGRLICGIPELSLDAFSSMCERMPEEEFQTMELNYQFNMVKQRG